DQLNAVLTSQDATPEYYFGLVAGTPLSKKNELPIEIRKHLRSNPRFKNFVNFWIELEREKARIKETQGWAGSRFGQSMTQILQTQSDALTKIIGKWTQIRLQNLRDSVVDFMNQAQLIDFETVNEQRKQISSTVDKTKDVAARVKLGRPPVNTDVETYWEFDEEYWVDELGYYYYTLRKECK
ncbi:MAG: hypothetical protein WC889_17410, partial [Myxococcota bacterium]